MITKREALILSSGYKNQLVDEMMALIEKQIRRMASMGQTDTTVVFPMSLSQSDAMEIQDKMLNFGYLCQIEWNWPDNTCRKMFLSWRSYDQR